MFFESRGSLLVAGVLLLAGCGGFFWSWKYADSATREKTTTGVITYIGGGKSSHYYYEFEIDGVKLYDESRPCKTALTPRGCKVGASVLVYYDHNPTLETRLQDFGDASRGDLIFGVCMTLGGLLLIVLHFVFKKALMSPDESDEIGFDRLDPGPEIVHIDPDK